MIQLFQSLPKKPATCAEAKAMTQLKPSQMESFSPRKHDAVGVLPDGSIVFKVFRADHDEELLKNLHTLENAHETLELACAAADIPMYKRDEFRGWVARHLGCWAWYQKLCTPIVGTELAPFQHFLHKIRPITEYIARLLETHFPRFAEKLRICKDKIPEECRYIIADAS